jgi:hypothetical protein
MIIRIILFLMFCTLSVAPINAGQDVWGPIPKEIRGYKVIQTKIELKDNKQSDSAFKLGDPRVIDVSLWGLTLEVPIIIEALEHSGEVDLLVFEGIKVNGTAVTIEDYKHPFSLPQEKSITLSHPIRIYVSTPNVLMGAVGELTETKSKWPVTGRVYICGHFKKFIFDFKRAVLLNLNTSIRNPAN